MKVILSHLVDLDLKKEKIAYWVDLMDFMSTSLVVGTENMPKSCSKAFSWAATLVAAEQSFKVYTLYPCS